jgi:protoporphyrinogen oxidase
LSDYLNRRDLLIAMLGLPAVMAGCHGSKNPGALNSEPEFPGTLVGPSVDLGHRLRDGWHVTPSTDAWEDTGVVIIGGGVAGLSAAWRLSAWAGLFYFASRVVRRGGESRPLITWPGGNSRLVEHLCSGLTRQLRLDTAALDIIPRDGGVDVIAVARNGTVRDGTARGIHAERVILAAPQFLARYLVQPHRQNPPPHLARFEYGSWLVANTFLRDRPAENGFPLAWDNVLYDSPSLGDVTATHQLGPEYGPTVLTYYYPFCDADPRRARQKLLDMDWRDCVELALTDLSRAHPDIRPLVERIDVMRWGHAMIRPQPGFIFHADRRAAAEPFRGIHFANTDLSGVALFEEAFYHGVRAAEEVLHARGRKSRSLL